MEARSMEACLKQQQLVMTMPVSWPGFHAFCIHSLRERTIRVLVHGRSSPRGMLNATAPAAEEAPAATLRRRHLSSPLLSALIQALRSDLLARERQNVDPTISTSIYHHRAQPWRLFTAAGHRLRADADLHALEEGSALWLYTGGQFLWPGMHIGHTFTALHVAQATTDAQPRPVTMRTLSLRPLVFHVSGFLSETEAQGFKEHARKRMLPVGQRGIYKISRRTRTPHDNNIRDGPVKKTTTYLVV
jgi:hypothetical protein